MPDRNWNRSYMQEMQLAMESYVDRQRRLEMERLEREAQERIEMARINRLRDRIRSVEAPRWTISSEPVDALIDVPDNYRMEWDYQVTSPDVENKESIKMEKRLDRKTIKNMEIFPKCVTKIDGYKDVVWTPKIALIFEKRIQAFKTLLETMDKDIDGYEEIRSKLQAHRKIRKNRTFQVVYKSPKHEVETYLTVENGKFVNGGPKDSRHFVLKRIREKIVNKRDKLKNPKMDVKIFQGYEFEMVGGVHCNPGGIKRISSDYKWNIMNQTKKPCQFDDYVGVEIEFISEYAQDQVREELIKADLHKHTYVKYDGSIEFDDVEDSEDWDDYYGHEVNVIAPRDKIGDIIERVCKVIVNKVDGRINYSCGLHVHLDVRNKNKEKVFRNLVRAQDLLFKLVDDNRQRSTYCHKVTNDDWNRTSRDHYVAINGPEAYDKFGTIEVRMHHGSTDAKEINNWIKLLNRISDFRGSFQKPLSSLNEVHEVVSIDTEVFDYYKRLAS